MGDVRCNNCKEPWDTYHLRYDEIWESKLSEDDKRNFKGKLTPPYDVAFNQLGWKFSGSIYAILRCPACAQKERRRREERLERAEWVVGTRFTHDGVEYCCESIDEGKMSLVCYTADDIKQETPVLLDVAILDEKTLEPGPNLLDDDPFAGLAETFGDDEDGFQSFMEDITN